MMTSRLFKILTILALTGLVAGCKVAIIVPSGGDVTSLSGTRNCSGGSLCEFNITDNTFNESFTAVARSGYVFSKWNNAPGFLCGDSSSPICVVSNKVLPDGYAGAFIAGGSFFYAMPLFDFVGIDSDGDGTKDHLDADDDNDGLEDANDACPIDPNLNCGESASTSCSVFAGNSVFCAQGSSPTCAVTRAQGFQIVRGMKYSEVVALMGCHGTLKGWSEIVGGSYNWGRPGGPGALVNVSFYCFRCTRPTEPTVDSVVVVDSVG